MKSIMQLLGTMEDFENKNKEVRVFNYELKV